MNEGTTSVKERLELRIALSRLDAVFEACNKLPEVEKELIYREIRKRVLRDAPREIPEANAAAFVSTNRTAAAFIDRCRGLADIAPNDKIRNALFMIVRACEAEMAEAAASNKSQGS
jgi:hypothetical protein